MRLQDYPQAIARLQRQILLLNQEVEGHTQTTKLIEAKTERDIYSDSSLKNEGQRKAQRILSLETNLDYQEVASRLRLLSEQIESLQIDLEQLQNEFSVRKLLKRETIALHSQIATRLDFD